MSNKNKEFIPNKIRLAPGDAELFLRRVIGVWSIGLPADRHLTERETVALCYMLANGNALGQVVDYTKGSYRKQLQRDLQLTKQGFSNLLRGLVRKRWMTRKHDEFLGFFNYHYSRELTKIRNMYFSGKYAGLEITVEIPFDA